jgi:hypothetical protein
MTGFLESLKADLLNRRVLPFLALAGVALLAALAYAVMGGSTSAAPQAAAPAARAATVPPPVAVSQAPANAKQAVAEVTSGAAQQRGGPTRNPFTPLPTAKTAAASTKPAATSKSSTTSSSASGKSTSGAGGTTPTKSKETTPAKPKKVYIHYHVAAQFGVVPLAAEGAPPQAGQLKTYKDLALDEPLPGKANPQLVYLGVVLSTGKDAVFALTGAAILHGSATCKPSPTQCQTIELQVGQSETLEVVEANGTPVTYELKLLSITKSVSTASAASAHAASKAGRELLRRDGVHAPSELRYSPERGGFVFAGHPVFAGRSSTVRAHTARRFDSSG